MSVVKIADAMNDKISVNLLRLNIEYWILLNKPLEYNALGKEDMFNAIAVAK